MSSAPSETPTVIADAVVLVVVESPSPPWPQQDLCAPPFPSQKRQPRRCVPLYLRRRQHSRDFSDSQCHLPPTLLLPQPDCREWQPVLDATLNTVAAIIYSLGLIIAAFPLISAALHSVTAFDQFCLINADEATALRRGSIVGDSAAMMRVRTLKIVDGVDLSDGGSAGHVDDRAGNSAVVNTSAKEMPTPVVTVGDGAAAVENSTAAHKTEPASREEDYARDSAAGQGDRCISSIQKPPRRRVLPFIGKQPVLMAAVLPWNREDEWRTVRMEEERVLLDNAVGERRDGRRALWKGNGWVDVEIGSPTVAEVNERVP
ncbi:hypothetical protein PIB30_074571 [Stylosanthes scabra]|uniref:Uncharacterized protein n=1 Tax=Stylosanthes scabra TaxID=79078 RepID=A0ABU6ZNC4_9FABA|nr:hypothetical protein [Stylosanthes scabra]